MNWDQLAVDYLAVAHEVLSRLRPDVEQVAAEIAARMKAGGRVLVCGNGGSAADAQHMAGELVNRFLLDRPPFAAIALSTDTSVLTAVGNDCGFDRVFEKQVLAHGRKGDVLIAFTTSGNSPNVVRAVEAARREGLLTVALTGGSGGRVGSLAERCLCVRSAPHTPRIQEGHHLIMHALCERIEELLAG